MKKFITILSINIFFLIISLQVNAQGCVAIRSTGGMCSLSDHVSGNDSAGWSMNINNRYFKSYKHYVGKDEQKYRVDSGSNVINHAYTMDIALTKHFNDRWSLSFDLPLIANKRTSLYEHDRKNRYATNAFGIGDVRVTAYRWMFDPKKLKKGNIQLGLGIKLPTGDYKFQDYFHNTDTTTLLGPVDQSIQLGDGGTGFTTELNAYYNFNHHVGVYGSFYYLFNPREQNGVSTARGGVASSTAVKYHTDVMSVPDQYMFRAGGNFTAGAFTASAGIRYERLPAKDVIGGNEGFRRPGYVFSVEPGLTYTIKRTSIYAYVPWAVTRDRIQSVSDMQRSIDTKTHVQGDAAFADYTVNLGISFRL
ncbi:MAG: hypothetical protein ABI861_03345 [Panacibacter sp.]